MHCISTQVSLFRFGRCAGLSQQDPDQGPGGGREGEHSHLLPYLPYHPHHVPSHLPQGRLFSFTVRQEFRQAACDVSPHALIYSILFSFNPLPTPSLYYSLAPYSQIILSSYTLLLPFSSAPTIASKLPLLFSLTSTPLHSYSSYLLPFHKLPKKLTFLSYFGLFYTLFFILHYCILHSTSPLSPFITPPYTLHSATP